MDTPDDGPGTDPAAPHADRRRFLRNAGLGAAAVLGGGFAGGMTGRASVAGASQATPLHSRSHGPGVYDAAAPGGTLPALGGTPGVSGGAQYGHGIQPPMGLAASALDTVTIPPPVGAGPLDQTIDVVETTTAIAADIEVDQWTFGGQSPGPILRATEGDLLHLTVRNHTQHDHNLHLHGRHSPAMDGWQPIPPGEEFTYEIEAGPAGLHPYHCHTSPLATHLSRGLYGAFIVDPVPPRPPALEFVLLLSGWDLDGDGRNEVYTYNGIAGWYLRNPIVVPVDALVRLHVLNMVEYDPVASFHLHAQTFDAFPSGTWRQPTEHTDTITFGQGERAIIEFTLPEQGRYMFHPHQHHMAEAGAMGWFAAV